MHPEHFLNKLLTITDEELARVLDLIEESVASVAAEVPNEQPAAKGALPVLSSSCADWPTCPREEATSARTTGPAADCFSMPTARDSRCASQ